MYSNNLNVIGLQDTQRNENINARMRTVLWTFVVGKKHVTKNYMCINKTN